MASEGLDTDTRLVVIISILTVMVVLIGSTLFYFRKKENDTIEILFRLEDRINKIEFGMHKMGLKTDTQPMPLPDDQ